MTERRANPRMRALKGAKIFLPGHRSTVECQVRNVSPAGAKLTLVSTVSVPDRFDLKLDQSDDLQPCQVAWRSLTEMGVRFARATDSQ